MRKLLLLLAVMLFAAQSFATCTSPNSPVGSFRTAAVGNGITIAGGAVTGCSVYVTGVWLTAINSTSTVVTFLTANVYGNTGCTGSPTFSIPLTLGATKGNQNQYTWLPMNPLPLAQSGGYCVSVTGAAGVILGLGFNGYEF